MDPQTRATCLQLQLLQKYVNELWTDLVTGSSVLTREQLKEISDATDDITVAYFKMKISLDEK